MYQSVISLLLAAQLAGAASPKQITKIYDDFAAKKAELLKADLNKKNAKETVRAAYTALEKSLDEVKTIEARSKDHLLTTEGNQMAYDLEILSPIKDLATGIINQEECTKARHEHKLNFPVVDDDDSQAVSTLIDKICN